MTFNTGRLFIIKTCLFRYDGELGRIEDIPADDKPSDNEEPNYCGCCKRMKIKEDMKIPKLGVKLEEKNEHGVNLYNNVLWQGISYNAGDSLFLSPGSFNFKIKQFKYSELKTEMKRNQDEETYPEYYRKFNVVEKQHISGSLSAANDPFQVGYIKEIYSNSKNPKPEDIKLRIHKYYRPENTHKGVASGYQANLNLLYWSDEGNYK